MLILYAEGKIIDFAKTSLQTFLFPTYLNLNPSCSLSGQNADLTSVPFSLKHFQL